MPRRKASDYGVAPVGGTTNGAENGHAKETTNGASHEAERAPDSKNLTEGTGEAANGEQAGEATLLDQAEAVRTSLRCSLDQVGNLVLALKRDRKKSRLVESTLSSLRQLQKLDV